MLLIRISYISIKSFKGVITLEIYFANENVSFP